MSEAGSAFLMHTCTIKAGETVRIEAQIWGVDSEEQDCMMWEPVPLEVGESSTLMTSTAVVEAVDGITTYVATKPTARVRISHCKQD